MQSSSAATNDGFILVKRGHKLCASRKGLRNLVLNLSKTLSTTVSPSFDLLRHMSPEFVKLIGDTVFAKSLLTFLSSVLDERSHQHAVDGTPSLDVVVYGLGNFTHRLASLAQLAFVIYLKNRFSGAYCVRVFAFDPVFFEEERTWMKENGIIVIKENERCLRTVTRTTLFFLPHCCRSLYNNALYANWDPESLRSAFVLGNSFSEMVESDLSKECYYKYLVAAKDLCTEIRLPSPKAEDCDGAFADQSLHYFDENALLPFMRDLESPRYNPYDEIEMFNS